MPRFVHLRHKPPAELDVARELIVACPPLRSNVNLSRIARTAGCCGAARLICCGTQRVIERIARDAVVDEEPSSGGGPRGGAIDGERAEGVVAAGEGGTGGGADNGSAGRGVPLEVHRTLPPVLRKLRAAGYQIVGLEQATGAESLHAFRFERRTVIVLGHERTGLSEELLAACDRVAEIPVWGAPHSLNVATSAAMALYEYCRQYPRG